MGSVGIFKEVLFFSVYGIRMYNILVLKIWRSKNTTIYTTYIFMDGKTAISVIMEYLKYKMMMLS